MFLSSNFVQARSLYRSLLRETRKLPYDYLRQFFRIKFRDEFEPNSHPASQEVHLRKSKTKRLNQELGKLRSANNGDHRSLQHVLDSAYGRKGKLRHELMEPYVKIPKSEMAHPMIQGVESSRPPVYSQAFRALLTSGLSRKTKPLPSERIEKPTKLASRANPNSEDALMLGPFSKRRHVNTLWRAYTHEIKYTIPPLDVTLSQRGRSNEKSTPDVCVSPSGSASGSTNPGVILGGFKGAGILEQLRSIAGTGGQNVMMTRRERRALSGSEVSESSLHPSMLPTRRLRRSHRWLLGKIPLLHCKTNDDGENRKPVYLVSLAKEALRNSKFKTRRDMGPTDQAWIVHGENVRYREREQNPRLASTSLKEGRG